MRKWLCNARLILPDRIAQGCLLIEDDVIVGVLEQPWPGDDAAERIDLFGAYLAPGFVEIHSHGAGGHDFMDGTAEAFLRAAETHLRHGVTTLFPTSVAASRDALIRFLGAFRQAKILNHGGANMPGVHLEGPYLNAEMRGAIDPRYIRDPDPAEYGALLEFAGSDIRRWTAAPELPGALAFGDALAGQGILASAGHTCADYAQMKLAYGHGYTHFTHLYSAMSTITRRNGFRVTGALESAFILEDATVEVIADGCHLPVELLAWVCRAKGPERVCLTGDAIRGAGTDAAESVLGPLGDGIPVVIEDGVAKLRDRSAFAGSVAMADRLLRTAHKDAGIPLHEAVRMMTLTPARVMGLDAEIGSIATGKRADLVVFDEEIQVKKVMRAGNFLL